MAAIHKAAEQGHVAEVERLLQADPECLNQQGSGGWTPLHWAAAGGHVEVVKLLLSKGEDDTIRDKQGHYAMYWAGHYHDRAEVTLILGNRWSERVKQEFAHKETVQAVHAAVQALDKAALIQILSTAPNLINCKDDRNNTPLLLAAKTGNLAMVDYLLQAGADPTLRNIDGLTPEDRATALGYQAVVERLRTYSG
jgi:ankyrin repeat protein